MNPFGAMNPFLAGGKDIEVWDKPGQDSWGEKRAAYLFTLHNVAVAPRTTKTSEGEGFRGRIASGYTLYLDHDQVAQIKQDYEFVITMPDGTRAFYDLDGFDWGANWDNPFSSFTPGVEVNLKFFRAQEPS